MQALPGAIYTAEQVRDLDRRAIHELGIPGYDLMTRAGHATQKALRTLWPGARSVAVLPPSHGLRLAAGCRLSFRASTTQEGLPEFNGHQLALTAGLTLARGERVLIIDADLQDPPELLPAMMTLMEPGRRRRLRPAGLATRRIQVQARDRVDLLQTAQRAHRRAHPGRRG